MFHRIGFRAEYGNQERQPARSGTYSSVGRRIGSDAGGLRFKSQTAWVRGKSIYKPLEG